MTDNKYELRILINGKPAQEFDHNDQSYIEGRIGTEYTLQIRNHSHTRVLAVPSVDGINVLDGKPAIENGPGYIINGNDSMEIKGFRKDMNTVGAFKFCQKSKSYCNEAGLPGNNGVIGVKIFEEKPLYFKTVDICNPADYWRDIKSTQDTSVPSKWDVTYRNTSDVCDNSPVNVYTSCCRSIKSEPLSIGTTWGQEKQSEVVSAEFDRGEQLAELIIYYASMTGLKELGVPVKKQQKIVLPKAFNAFATPPKNWKG